MIRCAVFDFDGTLVDSNQIKVDAYYSVAAEYEGASGHLRQILADRNSGDRYAVCAKLAERLTDSGVTAGATETLARSLLEGYGARCLERIAACSEIPGAAGALTRLKELGLSLYVNSSTPEAPLQEILQRRELIDFFDGILGAARSKAENLKLICRKEGFPRDQVVMIGDMDVDCHAAREVGCYFVGVASNDRVFGCQPHAIVPDLTRLVDCIQSLPPAGITVALARAR